MYTQIGGTSKPSGTKTPPGTTEEPTTVPETTAGPVVWENPINTIDITGECPDTIDGLEDWDYGSGEGRELKIKRGVRFPQRKNGYSNFNFLKFGQRNVFPFSLHKQPCT